jgi:hypothetical protein
MKATKFDAPGWPAHRLNRDLWLALAPDRLLNQPARSAGVRRFGRDHYCAGRMVIKKRKSNKQDEMAGDPAFDQWVSRQLHKAYDEVLAEEVPPALLEALERLPADEAPSDRKPAPAPDKPRRRRS